MLLSAVKKRRVPANDRYSGTRKKLPCVRVNRTRSFKGTKIASLAVLSVFTVTLVVGVASFFCGGTQHSVPQTNNEPLGIVLSTPAPADDTFVEALRAKRVLKKAAPILTITVEDEKAPVHASRARRLLRQGRLKEALFYQRRALELDPLNMSYRLTLATIHDRLFDARGAAMLYKQVLDASGRHDKALFSTLDLDSVRARYAYLIRVE